MDQSRNRDTLWRRSSSPLRRSWSSPPTWCSRRALPYDAAATPALLPQCPPVKPVLLPAQNAAGPPRRGRGSCPGFFIGKQIEHYVSFDSDSCRRRRALRVAPNDNRTARHRSEPPDDKAPQWQACSPHRRGRRHAPRPAYQGCLPATDN